MFIRKFLSASKVDDVNAKGRFIKVMNCEGVLRLRATYQGHLVLDSDARAGFDVQTSQPFDQIQITSEIEQKLELWVSEHKLSYDALSTKPSKSSSFMVKHLGQSQIVAPYDPQQSSLLIGCDDAPIWIGGEGVNKETGFLLSSGEKYIHNSAAPIYAFVDAVRGKVIDPTDKVTKPLSFGYTNPDFYAIGGGYFVGLRSTSYRDVTIYNSLGDVVVNETHSETYKTLFFADNTVWIAKKFNGQPLVIESLISFDGVNTGKVFNIGYDEFNPNSAAAIGGQVYLLLSKSSGTGSKFISFNLSGGVSELVLPAGVSGTGDKLFYDAFTGRVWLCAWAIDGLYSYEIDTAKWVSHKKSKNGVSQVSFSESYYSVGQSLYTRDEILLTANYDAYYTSEGGITAFKGLEVFQSYDGQTFTKIDDISVKAKSFYSDSVSAVLYMEDASIADTPRALAYYPLIDDGKEKAKLKVFKESY